MAKIDILTGDMVSLSTGLKKISSVIADAEKMAADVQSGLDFQVAAKSDISGGIAKARKNLQIQSAKMSDLANLTSLSCEEFTNADGQMDKKAQVILRQMKLTTESVLHSVKDFFTSCRISQHKAVNDVFMTTGSVMAGATLGYLINAAGGAAVPKGDEAVIIPPRTDNKPRVDTWSTSTGGKTTTTTVTTVGGKTTTTTTTTTTKPTVTAKPTTTTKPTTTKPTTTTTKPTTTTTKPATTTTSTTTKPAATTTPKKAYAKLDAFDSNKFKGKTKGNYSNYSIVPGMKPEYVVSQHGFPKTAGFSGGGCTSCTYWTIAAAYKGTTNLNGIKDMKPTASWSPSAGAAADYERTNPASIYKAAKKYKGEEQYLETIYKNLVNGTPIGVRMVSKTGASGHTVSCIGLKNGTDIESFKKQLSALNRNAKNYTKQRNAIIKSFQKNILIADSADGKIRTLDAYTIQKGTSLWYPDGAKMLK